MQLAMINDKVLDYDKVDSAYLDRGTFFGDGVYEVVRSYKGKIFALDKHLQRFARSLKAIMIDGVDIDDIRKKVVDVYQRSQITDAKIYFHITRGSGTRNHFVKENAEYNFFLTVTELGDVLDQRTDGISVCSEPDLRWKRCDIKSLNLLANVMALIEAKKKDCQEAILVDDAGNITEGAGSAFFMIKDNELITRPLGHDILPSITRDHVVHIAGAAGLKIVERTFTPDDAANADELFIAVSTRDIVPVIKFDDKVIGHGKPGEYVQRLQAEFAKLVG